MGVNEELIVLKNIVRIGTVSSIDIENRTARVNFADKNNLVSGPLKMLKNTSLVIGDLVLCIFLPNGKGDGFVVGGI